MSQFLLYKKLGFETGTHPPLMSMSQNTKLFFDGFPKYVGMKILRHINLFKNVSNYVIQFQISNGIENIWIIY